MWLEPKLAVLLHRSRWTSISDPHQALSVKSGDLEESLVYVPNCQAGRWFLVKKEGNGSSLNFQIAYERGFHLSNKTKLNKVKMSRNPF